VSNRAVGVTRVVVAGAGIAGLAVAHELVRQAPDAEVLVLESRDRVGGNIRSDRIDGYLCEAGPGGFLDNAPATLALVDEIGLTASLQPSRNAARRRFIFRGGRLHEVPLRPTAFLRSGLLSLGGTLRIAAEPFVRPAPAHDETIHEFASRHIGIEAADVMVGSMVSGIFAGDAHALSLRSCFPKMAAMEAAHGSLFRAMIARRRARRKGDGVGAPSGVLRSFTGGMEQLPMALAATLGRRVRTDSRVIAISPRRGYQVGMWPRAVGTRAFTVRTGGQSIEADAVVLAGPASESADLIRPFDAVLGDLLTTIPTAPLAVVCLGYDEVAVVAERGPLDGFGFLIPRGEGPRILGALWESSIYPGRATEGKALIRVMIGGAIDPAAIDLDDAALVETVRRDLARTMDLRARPEFVRITRHRRGIPQYTVGHESRLARITGLLRPYPGLFVAGNSYRGVSINACIEGAPVVASRVIDHLRKVAHVEEYRLAR
jgi:oxygen-dependent protoporphyrinogen oxidase